MSTESLLKKRRRLLKEDPHSAEAKKITEFLGVTNGKRLAVAPHEAVGLNLQNRGVATYKSNLNDKKDQFDDIFLDPPTFVEYKGSGRLPPSKAAAIWSDGKKYEQGTWEHADATLTKYEDFMKTPEFEGWDPKVQSAFRKSTKTMRAELNDGTAQFKMVTQVVNPDGSLGNVVVDTYLLKKPSKLQ